MQRWLWLALVVIIFDQLSKQLAEAFLNLHQPVYLLPFFDLTLMYNKGAAFSFLSDQGGWQRWFFIGLALAVTSYLVFWVRRLGRGERWVAVALSLVIGGAIGNVVDRIFYGQVIDFIHLHYQQWYWPAFNIADSAITVGVVVLIFDSLFLASKRSN
ncbi:signal peptidase II [endosymbiont of Riftia pachyptila]|nr:signal peptidase II [endosymbiont of Riftia pachyptila]